MKTEAKQIKENIINECNVRKLSSENVDMSCELALIYFKEGHSLDSSVKFGVSIIEI